jgi:hypothetical protein
LRATKREGLTEVPLVIERDMDDERAFAMMVGDNDSPENGPFHPFSRRENTLTKNLLQNRV